MRTLIWTIFVHCSHISILEGVWHSAEASSSCAVSEGNNFFPMIKFTHSMKYGSLLLFGTVSHVINVRLRMRKKLKRAKTDFAAALMSCV